MAAKMATFVFALLVMRSVGVVDRTESNDRLETSTRTDAEEEGSVSAINMRLHSAARSNDPMIRNTQYARDGAPVLRFVVPDDKVSWGAAFPEYAPPAFTMPFILPDPPKAGPVWADNIASVDATTGTQDPVWLDRLHRTYYSCGADRTQSAKVGPSTQCWNTPPDQMRLEHPWKTDGDDAWNIPHEGNLPLNPMGRTGMSGRGLLGKFGANHAADPLVTRWKNGRLEIALIKRNGATDPNEMAIPGGMVDAGDSVSRTLIKEFLEEGVCGNMPEGYTGGAEAFFSECEDTNPIVPPIKAVFAQGALIYTGYVDDPRNTDNAWMETAAYHFHGENGAFDTVKLHAGDDAAAAQWQPVLDAIDGAFPVYASHKDLITEMYNVYCGNNRVACFASKGVHAAAPLAAAVASKLGRV